MSETSTSATNGPDVADMPARSRLSFDLDVDICVVGAGLAGLTVALEAARLGASVAVLEGRHIGWNASGHQLGTVMPGYGLPIGELIAHAVDLPAFHLSFEILAEHLQPADQLIADIDVGDL